ncbi:polyadenylate-binding protein 1-like, partial [Osmerus eperlanus]|uniref:polyadenylate-binding protein 1-like n=1 Tax=Osmerus eperlanus TaxID=29151 RepID=UPI002E11871C
MNQRPSSRPKASLYVGDIHQHVTEAMLYNHFSPAGTIHSIRVCRDRVNKRSLGYAYVNFKRSVDAEHALDFLNFKLTDGSPIRVTWAHQRDPTMTKSGVGKVFIKNLDTSIDNENLYDTFSGFGKILSSKIACGNNGSKGYGFVQFETAEAAEKSIERLDGMLFNDRKAFVGRFKSRKERQAERFGSCAKFTNIYIKNFGQDVDEQKLTEVFSKYGKITSVCVMKDENGKSRGFGFVNFERHEDAQKAVDDMKGMQISGKLIYVGRAQKRLERQSKLKRWFQQNQERQAERFGSCAKFTNIYIKNFGQDVDEQKLTEVFSKYGKITSVCVMKDENGKSRGFGFVNFERHEDAQKAVDDMKGMQISGKLIYVGRAQKRLERQSKLKRWFQQNQARMTCPSKQLQHMSAQIHSKTKAQVKVQTLTQENAQVETQPKQVLTQPLVHLLTNTQPSAYVWGKEPLTASTLASTPLHYQNPKLGVSLISIIHKFQPHLAEKLTGMFLEMENDEVIHLLGSPQALHSKINQA